MNVFFFVSVLEHSVSDRKVYLVVFKNVRKNPKKVTEKQKFLRKTSFRQNRFFLKVVIQKNNHYKYLNFSLNIYIIIYRP
ncbi:Uncharacterized protein FWK35_00034834, partial [Aphis craccivora]